MKNSRKVAGSRHCSLYWRQDPCVYSRATIALQGGAQNHMQIVISDFTRQQLVARVGIVRYDSRVATTAARNTLIPGGVQQVGGFPPTTLLGHTKL